MFERIKNIFSPRKHTSELLSLRETPESIVTSQGYNLIREIGEGGFGIVWLARKNGSFCALKIIPNKSGRDAYKRELKALQKLRAFSVKSEFLVNIIDIIKHNDFLAYAMDCADDINTNDRPNNSKSYEAKTLSSFLSHAGRLGTKQCVNIGLRIIDGAQALHNSGLVHRDIKPANIIFVNQKAVLADIGLVTNAASEETQFGTEGYSPSGKKGRINGDVHAIGKMLYVMATGYSATTPGLPFPDGINDTLFGKLNTVIKIACHSDPDKQYINCKALRVALEHVLVDEENINLKKKKLTTWGTIKRFVLRSKLRYSRSKSIFKLTIIDRIDKEVSDIHTAGTSYQFTKEMDKIIKDITHEFERRIGYVPHEVFEACTVAGENIRKTPGILEKTWDIISGGADPEKKMRNIIEQFKKSLEEAIDTIWDEHKDQLISI